MAHAAGPSGTPLILSPREAIRDEHEKSIKHAMPDDPAEILLRKHKAVRSTPPPDACVDVVPVAPF